MAIAFPARHRPLLDALVERLIKAERDRTPSDDALARELLEGFHATCLASGLDRVLVQIQTTFPRELPAAPVPDGRQASGVKTLLGDPKLVAESLSDHPDLRAALAPRLAGVLTSGDAAAASAALVAVLVLEFREGDGQPLAPVPDTVRSAVTSTVKGELDRALAPVTLRESVLKRLAGERTGRTRAFNAIAPMVDERGVGPAYADVAFRHSELEPAAINKTFVALERSQAQSVEEACRTAIDAAKRYLEEGGAAEVATRIDRPVSHKLTPFDVAIGRVIRQCAPTFEAGRVAKELLDALTELVPIAWAAPDPKSGPLKPYNITVKLEVGDRVQHKSFGEGLVVSVTPDRAVVDFSGERRTLVHGR